MFERFKIKKLLTRLPIEEREHEKTKLINQLIGFGKDSFLAVANAFQNREISAEDSRIILLKTYDASFFDNLLQLSGHANDVVRALAKEIILNKTTNDDIPKLIDNLQNPNIHIRTSCTNILNSLKNPTIVIKLISIYNNADATLKNTIIDILGSIGGNTAARLLISALKDKEWSVRIRAVRGLSKMKDPIIAEPLLEILNEKDAHLVKAALDALTALGDKRVSRPIIALLKNPDLIIRQKVVDCLCVVGDSTIVPEILGLMRDNDVNIRRCAVEILNNLKDPRTGEALVNAMKDADWWVREVATDALAEIKGERIINVIKTMLKDTDENIRRCAVHFFNKVEDKSAVPALIETLSDKDWWVREKAVTALGRLKAREAIGPITALLYDDEIKGAIPAALGEIGGNEVIEPLLKLLHDIRKHVRIETLKAFSILKDETIIPNLKELLNDADEEVRNEAARALKEITGKVYRIDKAEKGQMESDIHGIRMKMYPEGAILSEAILVVDLCNSTGIAAKYGDQFALELKNKLTDIAIPLAKQQSYQYIKSTGDGFLITFPTIRNSVQFAVDLLKDVRSYNSTVDESHGIAIRFAINFGETRVDSKGDRVGVATNMTFRVEGVKPKDMIEIEGGIKKDEMKTEFRILISENVVDEAKTIDGITVNLLGLFELKGVSGLHRVFELCINK
jgi:HEAT repeat protein/class 3 adenylate cyclase